MGPVRRLVSLITVVSLLLTLAGTASAAYPEGVLAAAQRMAGLGLIQGRNPSNPNDLGLNDPITRAELVTVIVRAFGYGEKAPFLVGARAFPDTGSHWASGEIAIAKNLIQANGYTMGMPDGTFNPDGKVTTAQAIAFLVKFLGLPFDAMRPWPANYFDAAVQAGVITAGDRTMLLAVADLPATRGLVFYIADSGFANSKFSDGKTMYTKYVKTTPPTLTVEEPAPTSESRVTITGTVSRDASTVYVGSAQVTRDATGRFSSTVELTIGDNPITVRATDLVGNEVTKTVKVSRTPGVVAVIEAPPSITVGAGKLVDFPVIFKDARGNVIKDAPLTVTSDFGTYAGGKFTAGQKVGSGTVSLKSGNVTASVPVTVTGAALAKLTISPATVELAAGASQRFTVSGVDSYGNPVTVPGPITWSSNRGVMSQDGTWGATSDAAGVVTVTATAGGISGTASVSVFGYASRIALSVPSGLVANGVSKQQISVSVQDATGNVARGFNGIVLLLSNNPSVVSLGVSSVQVTGGVASVELTAGTVVGTAVISASSSGLTGATAIVTTLAQTPASVMVTADPALIAADYRSRTTVTAVLNDQSGSPVKTISAGNWTVDFVSFNTTVAGPASVIGVPVYYDSVNGRYQAVATFTAGGNLGTTPITVTVKRDGFVTLSGGSTSISSTLVGPPFRLAIDSVSEARTFGTTGTTQQVIVRVLDANGNQVTSAGSDISNAYVITDLVLTRSSGTSAVLPAVNGSSNAGNWTSGKAVFLVTDSKAESVTYTATGTWSGYLLAKASATGLFRSGPAAGITLTANPSVLSANGTASGTLTAKVVDQSNNPVEDGTFPVTFRRTNSGNNAIVNWNPVTVNSAGGVATVTVFGGTNIATDVFTAEANLNGTYVTTSAPAQITTAIIGVPFQVKFDSAGVVASGTEATVVVKVYDAYGTNVVTYDNSSVVTMASTDPLGGVETYTVSVVSGVATFKFTPNKSGTYILRASAAGLRGATGSSDNPYGVLVVTSGAPAGLKLSANTTTLAADSVSLATVTVTLVDPYGNPTPANSAYNLDSLILSSGTPSAVDLSGGITYYKADGTTPTAVAAEKAVAKAGFRAGNQPSSSVIMARKSGLADGTLTLTTIFGGFTPNRVSLAVDEGKKVTIDSAAKRLQKVTVYLTDVMGNRVTNPGNSIYAKLTMTGSPSLKAYTDAAGTVLYDDTHRPQFTPANAGQLDLFVTDEKAEQVTYQVDVYNSASGGTAIPNIAPGSTVGVFTNEVATQIGVTAAPAVLAGNGSNVSVVTVTVQDAKGNPVTDVNGTLKLQIPPAQGGSHAYIIGASSDGWFTTSVLGGQAIAMVQARYTTSSAGVYVEAQYFTNGSSIPSFTMAPTRVISVGSGADNGSPIVTGMTTTRATNGVVTAGDSFAIAFNEPTNMPVLSVANFVVPPGKSLGNATFGWSGGGTVLTIYTGAGVNLSPGDQISFANAGMVTDQSSNAFGTGLLFTVDVTAPTVAVAVNRAVPGQVTAGDTFVLTFNELTREQAVTNASFNNTGGRTFGNTATFGWSAGNTLTIQVGTGGSIIGDGDVIAFAAANTVTDRAGLGAGTGGLFTVDLNTLTVQSVAVNRATNTFFKAGDTMKILFSRETNAPTLTAADFVIGNSHTLGTGATFAWNVAHTELTITGAGTGPSAPTLTTGDTVRLANPAKIKDLGGNSFGTGNLFTADVTAVTIRMTVVRRATAAVYAVYGDGDTLTVTFSEPTNAPTNLTAADFTISNGHELGAAPTFGWNPAKTVLTITLHQGDPANYIREGDTLAFVSATRIKDAVDIPFGSTNPFWTIDETPPAVDHVQILPVGGTPNGINAGDKIKIVFTESLVNPPPALTAANFTITGGALGDEVQFDWATTTTLNDTLIITLGSTNLGLGNNDTIAFAANADAIVTDQSGNPVGTGLLYQVVATDF